MADETIANPWTARADEEVAQQLSFLEFLRKEDGRYDISETLLKTALRSAYFTGAMRATEVLGTATA